MNIVDGIKNIIKRDNISFGYHGGLRIRITNIENLKCIIREYLDTYHLKHSNEYKLWESLLDNDKECHRTLAISLSSNFASIIRTKRKDIIEDWSNSGIFLNDYDIPGSVEIEKNPKRKLEL